MFFREFILMLKMFNSMIFEAQREKIRIRDGLAGRFVQQQTVEEPIQPVEIGSIAKKMEKGRQYKGQEQTAITHDSPRKRDDIADQQQTEKREKETAIRKTR